MPGTGSRPRWTLSRPPAPSAGWHGRLDRCLVGAVWVILAAYTFGLLSHGSGFEPFVDGWLGILTQALPAAACWSAVAVNLAGPRWSVSHWA